MTGSVKEAEKWIRFKGRTVAAPVRRAFHWRCTPNQSRWKQPCTAQDAMDFRRIRL